MGGSAGLILQIFSQASLLKMCIILQLQQTQNHTVHKEHCTREILCTDWIIVLIIQLWEKTAFCHCGWTFSNMDKRISSPTVDYIVPELYSRYFWNAHSFCPSSFWKAFVVYTYTLFLFKPSQWWMTDNFHVIHTWILLGLPRQAFLTLNHFSLAKCWVLKTNQAQQLIFVCLGA